MKQEIIRLDQLTMGTIKYSNAASGKRNRNYF